MKLASVAISALAISLAACTTAQVENVTVAPASEPVGIEATSIVATEIGGFELTPEGAGEFISAVEEKLKRDHVAERQAMWLNETNITLDSDSNRAFIDSVLAERRASFAVHAVRFAQVPGLAPDVARKLAMLRYEIDLPVASTPGAAAETAAIKTALNSAYGKGAGTLRGEAKRGSELEELMGDLALSPDDYQEMWTSWHDNTGAPMKADYARFVELTNAGARELGFADVGAMWRSKYDMSPDEFAAETERLWQEVKPLYVALHTYVRGKLNERYGDEVQPATGAIRADLLGNMWAQSWGTLYPVLAPKVEAGPQYDLTGIIVDKQLDAKEMVRVGEAFFSSLGFEPMPETFWTRSQFVRPQGREVVCHASAWDIADYADQRIKMCIQPTAEMFSTIHHELGHNYYYRAYGTQDYLFRESAHDGFHEAIGDTIVLSITPDYLAGIGFIDQSQIPSEEGDVGLLLNTALDRVAFLPFGLLVDRWRWGVYDGSITPEDYNEAWTSLRHQYQGIVPPAPRPAGAFDPGAKFHVPGNTSYTRYFLAHLLMFQFYKAACDQAGWEGPLHRCSFYGNEEVGKNLNAMLEMGASKPWPDALEAFTGERQMSGKALMEYFAPLKTWLDEQNKGQPQGW